MFRTSAEVRKQCIQGNLHSTREEDSNCLLQDGDWEIHVKQIRTRLFQPVRFC
jgi:hypothetical protein